MCDAVCVARIDGHEDLPKDAARLRLLQPAMGYNELEELAAGDVLGHQEDVARPLDNLEKIDDMRMLHVLQNLDLSRHALHIAFVRDSVLLEHLDRHTLPGEQMHAELHLAKGALAEGLSEHPMSHLHPECRLPERSYTKGPPTGPTGSC